MKNLKTWIAMATLCVMATAIWAQDQEGFYSNDWDTLKLKGLNLMRLEVPGGWFVREGIGKMALVAQSTRMMIFVPDPNHTWTRETAKKWEHLKLKGLNLYRLKVPTGWLVREGWGKIGSDSDINMICYLEDQEHKWFVKGQ